MSAAFAPRFDPGVVALSCLTVALAAQVGLRLARRVCHADATFARLRWLAGALALGSAICALCFAGLLVLQRPAATGHEAGLIALAWLAAVGMAAFGLRGAARLTPSPQPAGDLHERALRDPLTGLPNRHLLDDRLQQAMARGGRREGERLVLMAVNLDGFRPLNESFGPAAGDHVLCVVARRLQALARSEDTLARLAADEFVLMLQGDMTEAALAQVAQRLLDALAAPMAQVPGAGSQPLRLSASVGIVLHDGKASAMALISQANSAARSVKRAGGNGFAFFEAHMQAGVREQVELARDLRAALAGDAAGGRLALHYQPKVATAEGAVTGVEALLRWQHPQRGAIGPGCFIPVAERFGLIVPLGDWVIDEACRQLAAWRDAGLQMRVAINLSVQQLRQPEALVRRFEEALARHAVQARQLTCEITESVAMDDAAATGRTLQRLASLGLALSIDDFGTGYSSLSYLRRLPVSQLKIDRSFVQDLETSADARAIVKAVIDLAHALALDVVAEGVETEGQAAVLRGKRCDKLQGYLFARPMPAPALTDWALRRQDGDGLRFSASVYAGREAATTV